MTVPAGVDSSAPGWSAYGLGLQVLRVDGRTLVGHGGSMPGFLAGVFVDREEQTGAVSLANATTRRRPAGLRAAGRPALRRAADRRPWRPRRARCRWTGWASGSGGRRRTCCGRWARTAAPGAAAGPQRAGQPVLASATTAPGWAWTATSPARRCGSPRTTWTWTPSSSRARPTTRRRPVPGGVDERGWRQVRRPPPSEGRCVTAWSAPRGGGRRSRIHADGHQGQRSDADQRVATGPQPAPCRPAEPRAAGAPGSPADAGHAPPGRRAEPRRRVQGRSSRPHRPARYWPSGSSGVARGEDDERTVAGQLESAARRRRRRRRRPAARAPRP